MNPEDILGNIDDLKKILDEATSSQTPIKQPRMIKEEPVRVTPKRDDGSDYGGDYDTGPEEAYSSDPLDPQPVGDAAAGIYSRESTSPTIHFT